MKYYTDNGGRVMSLEYLYIIHISVCTNERLFLLSFITVLFSNYENYETKNYVNYVSNE